LALLFFVKFPITPSERIISSIGREGIYRHDNVEGLAVTQTTTQTTDSQSSTTPQTTTLSTRHSDFVITVTTGKGFRKKVTNNSGEYDSGEYVADIDGDDEETTTTTKYYGYDYEYGYNGSTTTTTAYYSDYDNSYNYDWEY
ncbi:MAG: hypothetical protein K2K02_10965, partial [Ruminococcus sp.]|nr:hypothetical protein [Ruminococcus sp.]